jgi:hypothetical protein
MQPITLPSAALYKAILGFSPMPGNIGQIQNIFAVDDDSFAVFNWDSYPLNYSWECRVIDVPSLAVTYYASTGLSGNIQSAPLSSGPGNFILLWNDGSMYAFSVRNLKLNNPSPILCSFNQNTLETPCYNVISKIFYCTDQRTLAVASYYPNGGAGYGPVFSRNYTVGNTLIPIGTGGYAGWYTSVPQYDPWDKTTTTQGATNSQISSNGIDCSYGGNPTWVSRSAYLLTHGDGAGTPGCPTSVFDGTATPSGDFISNSLGTTFQTSQSIAVQGFCDSILNGLIGLSDWYGIHFFGDGGVWFYLPLQFEFSGVISAAVTKNYIAGVINHEGMSIEIFQTPSPTQLYNGASVTKTSFGLLNYARPISVIGKYKA